MPHRWLDQAEHDLKIAERNLAIEGYDTAAFLAHQAVEKLLIALILHTGAEPPRTHHIVDLARIACPDAALSGDLNELAPDYMISRYPDVTLAAPYREYDLARAAGKVEAAKRIFAHLASRADALRGGRA